MVQFAMATETGDVAKFVEHIYPAITNGIVAIIVILLGFVAGKIIERLWSKVCEQIELDKAFRSFTGLRIDISRLSSRILAYFVYMVFIIMALRILGIATTVLTLLSIIVGLAMIVFVFFGVSDLCANFLAGLYVRLTHKLHIGDHIVVKEHGINGKIAHITLVAIHLSSSSETVVVPYMLLLKSKITCTHK